MNSLEYEKLRSDIEKLRTEVSQSQEKILRELESISKLLHLSQAPTDIPVFEPGKFYSEEPPPDAGSEK